VNDDMLTCFKAQQRLLQIIKTHDIPSYEESINECLEEIPDYEPSNRINNLICDLKINSTRVINSGDRLNPYYCSNFSTNLL